MKKLSFFIILVLVAFTSKAQEHFRPPAYPLITVDPYFSIWSFNDTLNDASTVHWTGKENSLQGIIRVDGQSYYFLGKPITSYKTVLPLVEKTGQWKYTFSKPDNNWDQLHFNDASWKQGAGAFSTDNDAPNKWMTHDIWVRRTFRLNNMDFNDLMLNLHHDDNVAVYINGVLAYKADGWNNSPELFKISDAAKAALKEGENVLAIHCENTAGGAYLDAGLVDEIKPEMNIAKATQTSVSISATQTFYHFTCGGVELQLTFTDPLLANDLDIFSRPADYVTFKIHSADGKAHQVQLYFSVAGNIAVNTPDQQVQWQRSKAGNMNVMRVGTVSQNILGRKGDNVRIDWGYLYMAIPQSKETSTLITSSEKSVKDFVDNGKLASNDDKDIPRAAEDNPVTLAAVYDLGKISSTPVSHHIILAYNQIDCIEYFHQKLKPWWARKGMGVDQMLTGAERDYSSVVKKCNQFDNTLYHQTLAAGGEEYAKMCELAYRQAFAACKLAAGPEGNPLLFTKECFSNGDISTVDVIFPSCPITLVYNPVLLKALLDPIFYYCESGRWTKPNAPHDLGTFPIANGRKNEETMPIEETGNMLIMAAAITRAEGNASFAKKHWKVLSTWADYLLKYGMDPGDQLCTDDFAGPSAHNANLSIKAILGIASYGSMADMLGEKSLTKEYTDTAREMAKQWIMMDEDGNHFKLAFDKPGTWSQKYNLVWDKVLQLHIFPKTVAQKAIANYLTKQNEYGLPLDSRKTYTKADWIMWTATLADNEKDFRALIAPEYKYIGETPSRVPISDWYETTNAKQVGFQARSVVGGFFMKTLDKNWNGH